MLIKSLFAPINIQIGSCFTIKSPHEIYKLGKCGKGVVYSKTLC